MNALVVYVTLYLGWYSCQTRCRSFGHQVVGGDTEEEQRRGRSEAIPDKEPSLGVHKLLNREPSL